MFLVPREENTTSTMYPPPEGSPVQPQPASGLKKVDVVCDALRSAMESMDPNKSVMLYFIYVLIVIYGLKTDDTYTKLID